MLVRFLKALSARLPAYLLSIALLSCGRPDSAGKDGADQSSQETIVFATHMGEHPGWMEGFAACVRGYEKRHPDTKIKLHYQPLDGFSIWLETQFMGGRGPDLLILGTGDAYRLGARQGMLIPLTEYLDAESPYIPGQRWMDTMYPVVWIDAEDPIYGELWTIPFNFFTLRIFYNSEHFKQAGITETPETWEEFLKAQQKLVDAGFVPYMMPNTFHSSYVFPALENTSDMLFQNLTPLLDVLDYNGKVNGLEINAGIYNGTINLRDEEILAAPKLLRDWSKYWARGFNAMDRQQAKMLFAQGIGSMYLEGSWEAEALAQSVTFEWGVFPWPTVTKKSTPYADGPRNDRNFNLTFSVAKIAEDRGHLPQVIDFLQYLTSPEAADTLSHYVTFVSALNDYPIAPEMVDFAPDTGYPWAGQPWYVSQQTGSMESRDLLFRQLQRYLAHEIDEEELAAGYEPLYRRLVEEETAFALRENIKLVSSVARSLADFDSVYSAMVPQPIDTVEADPLESERRAMVRKITYIKKKLAKAQRQADFLTELLSRPPVWRSSQAADTAE